MNLLKDGKAVLGIAVGLVFAACTGCKSTENRGSELQERVPGTASSSWQNEALVQRYLQTSAAVRVNARSNYATYYENGQALSKWKVATGRIGKGTPKGIFVVHQKETCPPWNNGRGRSAGACAADNPLGEKALWFHNGRIYGMHGISAGNAAAVRSVTASDPRQRDASSGCVRNHPENIEWLFARAKTGMPVIIGLWDTDPDVVDCSGNAALCKGSGDPRGGGGPLLPQQIPAECAVNVSEFGGLANIRDAANLSSNIVTQLERTDRIKITKEQEGQSYAGSNLWYQIQFEANNGGQGYLHSSLVDCLR